MTNDNEYNTLCLEDTGEAIARAAELIRRGRLVAFPTETVYGLGADAMNPEAVARIFAAKERPADNPLIVHVDTIEALRPICHVTAEARALMDAFWPGPLTLLLKKKDGVPAITTAGLDTVAVRMPAHPTALALLRESGLPIAAPSANRSGRPSPTRASHVWEDMQGRIPMILDGGPCSVGLESTVLDMTAAVPLVLRPGGITREMLLGFLPEVGVAGSVLRPLEKDEIAASPGMRHTHYAPRAPLTMVKGRNENVAVACCALYDTLAAAGKRPFILAFSQHISSYGARHVLSLGSRENPGEMGERLFHILRAADEMGAEVIFSEVLPPEGIGLAVMNRLGRAAAFRTIDADSFFIDVFDINTVLG